MKITSSKSELVRLAPGSLIACVVAIAAEFLSQQYGAPAMLMALMLGMALHFLSEENRCAPGIAFSSRTLLRVGVALLGVRVSADLLLELGWAFILLVIGCVLATIVFGLCCSRVLGRGWRLGLLTGGAVGICGASAAMAISAILPKNQHSERNLIFTVISVTLLSTLAMVLYPLIVEWLDLNSVAAGVFLGASIHDVAQVVGAGFSVSEATAEHATLVKLVRVSLLAPLVLALSFILLAFASRSEPSEPKPPLLPGFIVGFIVLASLNSFDLLGPFFRSVAVDVSSWSLLVAIAAVGMKTAPKRLSEVGGTAIVLLLGETVFIGSIVLLGIMHLSA